MVDLTTRASRAYPGLPEPGTDLASHSAFLRAVKEALQVHERRTKDYQNSFVRLHELVDLGLAKIRGRHVVPTDLGGDTAAVGGGTDVDSILTTNGDLLTKTAGVLARLGVGSEGQILRVVSSLPTWDDESAGGGGNDPWYTAEFDDPPVSPNAMDDEFDDNSFDTGKWTWGNQGGATVSETSSEFGHVLLNTPANSGDQYRLLYQATPAAPYRFRAKVIARMTSANFAHAGLFVRNSANGRLYAFGPLYAGGAGMYIQAMTSVSAYSSTPYSLAGQTFDAYYYLDIEHNGTNLVFRWTRNFAPWSPFSFGVPTFTTALTVAPGTFLLAAPDQIGFCGDSNNSNSVQTYVDWFRRIS